MRQEEQDIEELLTRYSPSPQEDENAGKRVYYRLLLARSDGLVTSSLNDDDNSLDRKWRLRSSIIAAATVIASLLLTFLITNRLMTTPRNLGATQPAGDSIRSGLPVRANGPENMLLVLRDGSRVEMRLQSQVQIDDADDGLRIRLSGGSIIVTAAKQGAGHLYVETKDAIVSVIGTVFVVSADQDGSRVGVIEGVVNVQQGTTGKKLLPGEQIATNPTMQPMPLAAQVPWSRSAASYLALLRHPSSVHETQRAAAGDPAGQGQNAQTSESQNGQATRGAFERPSDTPKWEAVSIKPCVVPPGQRGGGVNVSAGRMVMNCQPVSAYIAWAYIQYADGQNHPFYAVGQSGIPMEGGPSWIRSDRYTINANTEGTPGKAMMQGPMLQTILEERFKLRLHWERREVSVFELTVSKGGSKLKRFGDGTCVPIDASKRFEDQPEIAKNQHRCPSFVTPKPPNLEIDAEGTSVEDFAKAFLSLFVDRPVRDRTGLKGLFNFHVEFAQLTPATDTGPPADAAGPSIFTALQEQFGLKLESAKGPGEFLVVDSIDRPTEN